MATIKYQLQSKAENAPIYLRLSVKRGLDLRRKTGLSINPKDWSDKTRLPKENNPTNKNLTSKLRSLKNSILNDLNNAESNGTEINGYWLSYRIDLYFDRVQETGATSNLLTDNIQRVITNAPLRKNSRGGIGLSKSRVNAYKGLYELIKRYEKAKRLKLKIKDIDLKFVNSFSAYMQKQKYNNGNIQKKIADIKTVCIDAQSNGVETSVQLPKVTGIRIKNDYILYLTEQEIEQIEQTDYTRQALANVKKWLLLGTMVGQRGNDLLNLNEDNIKHRNGLKLIELTQQKGNKEVVIPFSPKMETLLKYGFPYKISIQKLNKHLKDVCRLAEVNTITKGYKYNKETKRRTLGEYPKYELITSHDLRRTFATNYYTKMPTPLIMSITGHVKEETFLNYIGKTSHDYTQQIAEYFYKLSAVVNNETQLKIVKTKKIG